MENQQIQEMLMLLAKNPRFFIENNEIYQQFLKTINLSHQDLLKKQDLIFQESNKTIINNRMTSGMEEFLLNITTAYLIHILQRVNNVENLLTSFYLGSFDFTFGDIADIVSNTLTNEMLEMNANNIANGKTNIKIIHNAYSSLESNNFKISSFQDVINEKRTIIQQLENGEWFVNFEFVSLFDLRFLTNKANLQHKLNIDYNQELYQQLEKATHNKGYIKLSNFLAMNLPYSTARTLKDKEQENFNLGIVEIRGKELYGFFVNRYDFLYTNYLNAIAKAVANKIDNLII